MRLAGKIGLLPLLLSAQLPNPPYTPQEAIALMPKLPSIEGMTTYAAGKVHSFYMDESPDEDFTDSSDLSRFMKEYKAMMVSYRAALKEYNDNMQQAGQEISQTALNQERKELGGMSANDFSKLSKEEQEKIAMASAQSQLGNFGMGNIDISKLENMSEEEAEAYISKQVEASTGISKKDLEKFENMSEEEALAYFSDPENQAKMASLQNMAEGVRMNNPANSGQEVSISSDEITEMTGLSFKVKGYWDQFDKMEKEAINASQELWDKEFKAKYFKIYIESLKYYNDGLFPQELVNEYAAKLRDCFPPSKKIITPSRSPSGEIC